MHTTAFSRGRRFLVLTAIAGAVTVLAAAPARQQRGQGAGTQGTQTQGGQTPPPGTPTRGQGAGAQQPARDAQTTPTVGTASISGSVLLEGSGTPVRRARVSLNGQGLTGGRSVLTDDQGNFVFTALPAGRFTMNASKTGYVSIAYGAKKAGRAGTPIQLIDGQRIEKALIRMPKGSVVTGVVIDEGGEPSPGTQVRVLRFVTQTGERTLQQAGQDQTDDRGIYRIYGLQPGEYIVSAVPRQSMNDIAQGVRAQVDALMQQAAAEAGRGGGGGAGRGGQGQGGLGNILGGGRGQQLLDQATALQQQLQQTQGDQAVGYAPVYYPGTTAPGSASSVTLAVGEERAGVDFQLQLVPTAKIEGVVTNAGGPLPPGVQIMLMPAGQQNMPPIPGLNTNQARADQAGKFSFSNVTPGAYTVQARATVFDPTTMPGTAPGAPPGGPGARGGRPGRGGAISGVLWASAEVGVNGQNLSDVVLNLQPGLTVTGRVAFEGTAQQPPADLTKVRVMLNAVGAQTADFGGPMPPAEVDATGRFTIPGVGPGKYSLRGNVPAAAQNPQTQQTTVQQAGRAGGAGGGGRGGGGRGGAGAPGSGGGTGWVLKSAVVAGRDTLDFPLVIGPGDHAPDAVLTFTDRTQELTGTLQDASGRPTADYMIIVFPIDNRYWVPQARRIAATRPGTDGSFTIRTLPPGEYRLTAVTDAEPGEWYDPAFLSQLVGPSLPFTLAAGEKKTQDIKLAGGGW